MKVLTVVGARPQFVKAAAISRAFQDHRPDVTEVLVHTGLHYDSNMLDVFFGELEIPTPDHNLGVGGGTHGQNTGRMLEKLETIDFSERPDWMLVFGDTDSTLAGALVAAKEHIPLAHVEAGLRSFNRRMPEEVNRALSDHVSKLLFAPTVAARENLIREGIDEEKIRVLGDVMFDAVCFYKSRARKPVWFDALGISDRFALCTVHRAENTGDLAAFSRILDGLANAQYPVHLPVHPRTQKTIHESGLNWPANVNTVDPVGYLEMVWLESQCSVVLTDSGGVQKEAFFHRKPCITPRQETEWVELVECGRNQLAGSDAGRISELLTTDWTPSTAPELYGKGNADELMVKQVQ